MKNIRTDMADERRGGLSQKELDSIKGLDCHVTRDGDIKITLVEVSSPEAARAMGKEEGRYITLDLGRKWQNDDDLVLDVAHKLAKKLIGLLPREGGVLTVGLGNRFITADSLGPRACEKIIVTRHLRTQMPDIFGPLREVSCISPGVMGQTGMEAAELVESACRLIKPSAVIAIDALAAAGLERLGNSFQLSTCGITPGEGAGNGRFSLTESSLGVPVIAIGVPTVADARVINEEIPFDGFLISPGDIDLLIAKSAKAVGYAVNLALQGDMPVSQMEQLLA